MFRLLLLTFSWGEAVLIGILFTQRIVSSTSDQVIETVECNRCFYLALPGRQFHQCHLEQRSECSTETYVAQLNGGFERNVDGNCHDVADPTDTFGTPCRSTSWPFRSPSARLTTTAPSTLTGRTLPAGCFNPTGSSCDWYRDCLEAEYPCADSGYGYAIEFGDKYCRQFVRHYDSFSTTGRRWQDFVRKCLQVELVDRVLKAETRLTCRDIRRIAFESHIPCYLYPPPGEPSACDLYLSDWIALAWNLRSAFASPSTAVKVIHGALTVFCGCLFRYLSL